MINDTIFWLLIILAGISVIAAWLTLKGVI